MKNKFSLLILPSFLESANTLPKQIKPKLIKILNLLSKDIRHPGLQTKKIKSSKEGLFECRVDRDIRLVYDNNGVNLRCWFVGNHDIALNYKPQNEIIVDDIELFDTLSVYNQDISNEDFIELTISELEQKLELS